MAGLLQHFYELLGGEGRVGLPQNRRQTRDQRRGKGGAVARGRASAFQIIPNNSTYPQRGHVGLDAAIGRGAQRTEWRVGTVGKGRAYCQNRVGIGGWRNVAPGVVARISRRVDHQHPRAGRVLGSPVMRAVLPSRFLGV